MNLILEVIGDPFGVTAVLIVCLAFAGLGLMIFSVARKVASRRFSVVILLAAAAYAALNVGVFTLTFSRDSIAIFQVSYVVSVGVLAPALGLAPLLLVPKTSRRAARLAMIGFGSWVVSVGLAHLWVVAAAAASV